MVIEYLTSCCILTHHIYLYDWRTLLLGEQLVDILSLPSVRICLYLIWFGNPTTITFRSIHNHSKPQHYVGLSLINDKLYNIINFAYDYPCRIFVYLRLLRNLIVFLLQGILQIQSNRSKHLLFRYQNLSIKLTFNLGGNWGVYWC